MFAIDKHTVRCPRCKSDEYLSEAIMRDTSGQIFTIKTCHECGQSYKVREIETHKENKARRSLADIIGAFTGYVFIGFMFTMSLAMLYIMYMILRWIFIGLWG